MKKVLAILLALITLAMGAFLVACDEEDDPNKGNENQEENNEPSGDNSQNENTPNNNGSTEDESQTGGESGGSTEGGNTQTPHTHSFGEWKTVTKATCTTAGLKRRICSCGESEEETITEKGHNYQNKICLICGEKKPSEGLAYRLNDYNTGYIVTGIGACTDTEVVIPNKYNGKPVTKIDADAFYDCSGITSITIPENITSIGNYAFDSCTGLTEIRFNAKSMNNLSEENNVFSYAGQNRNGIKVIIGKNVKKIPDYLFCPYKGNYQPKILSVEFEADSSVTSIGDYAFYDCTGLKGVYISDIASWCKIDFGSYSYYNSYHSNPLYYARNLYLNGTLVTEIVIPDSVTSIKSYAFYNCSNLTSVTIPDRVTSIGYKAFEYCTGLTSITIPNSVTSIGYYAFKGCTKLESITIPNSVTSIGDYVFEGCTGLTSITIPNRVTSIGDYAFRGCTGLTSITIPNRVTSIGDYAFKGCTGLTSITIGNGVTSIGHFAFEDCTGLKGVYISDIASWCEIAYDYYSCNPLNHAHNLYLNGKLITELVIPDSVTSIVFCAFEGCTGLKNIYYTGTQAQWNAISKGNYWNNNTGNYTMTYNYKG